MKTIPKAVFTAIFFLLTSSFAIAQDAPKLDWKVGGTVQAMASYVQTGADTAQIGFGLRRVRLKTSFSYGDVTAFIQYSARGSKLLDARMTYKFSKVFNLRVGRFIGASVRGGGLTSHTKLDIVERPMSAQMWTVNALKSGDYRDYGVALMGKAGDFGYNLTVANGGGSLKNIVGTQLVGGQNLTEAVSISAMANYKPKAVKGLEVGGYYGMGNAYFNDYSSYNAYVYWEPKPLRIKAEIISVTDLNGSDDVSSLGYYVFGAFSFMDNWEALARYENYDPTDMDDVEDAHTLITIGARYALYPAKLTASKITFAYVMHGEEGDAIDNDVFYVMFQTAF